MAVAHRILTIAWHIIAEGSTYYEFGSNHRTARIRIAPRGDLCAGLEQLGFEVEVKVTTRTAAPSAKSPLP